MPPAGGNGTDSVLLCAGTYSLTVTDALGCTGTTSVDVISPPAINIDAVNYTDTIGCFGDSTGYISVQASGGTGSLTFTLLPSTPSETADSGYFSGLPVGTYTIRIEDAKRCYIDTTVTIYQPDPLVLVSAAVTDSVFCTGDNNGRIVATASGGTTPYSFILEPVHVINDSGIFENLAPGSYMIRLTDANSCDTIDSDTLILGIPVLLAIDTVIITPILCNGDLGALTVVASGGRLPYSVSVLGGAGAIPDQADTTIFPGLGAGNYDVLVTDANGCNATWPAIALTDPPPLVLDSIIITPIADCYTNPVGQIRAYASGGTGLIEYSINGTDYQAANLFGNLPGGDYTVYYRDANGCEYSKDTSMASPSLLLGNPVITHVQGDGYGSILLNPSGGIPYTVGAGYRYSIDGGALTTDPLFDTLVVGPYDVHVEDSLGCPWDTTINIIVIDLDVDVVAVDARCYGEASGEIRIWMNDGTPPYTITLGALIIPNITGNFFTIDTLESGNYALRIEDFTGRRFDTLVTINDPPPINVTKSTNDPACHEYELDGNPSQNGSISYTSIGGAGGFTYAWSDGVTGDSSRAGLQAGTYTVTIQDANNCEIINTTILEGEEVIGARMGITPIPNDLNLPPRFIEDTTICYLSRWQLRVYHQVINPSFEWTPELLDFPDDATEDTVSITAREEVQVVVYVRTDRCMDFELINISLFDTLNSYIGTDGFRIGDTIYQPQGQPLSLYNADAYAEYSWSGIGPFSTTTGPITTLTPTEDQLVTFFGTTHDGCIEKATVFVRIQRPIKVYAVFTPNEDGFNDYWFIPNAIQYPNLEVVIFNRWGQQVFYSKPYGIDMHHMFDGKSQKNGKDLPVGTYYYIISPNDGIQDTFTGTVTIVR
ncbi:hypothetical protein ES703_45462 [subsurface metagenome]